MDAIFFLTPGLSFLSDYSMLIGEGRGAVPNQGDIAMTLHASDTAGPAFVANATNAELAAFVLRVSMGILFVIHGGMKLFVFTPAGTAAFFEKLGFPGPLAYVVIAAELLGGIALLVGFRSRWVSLALVPILLGSIYAPHGAAGFIFSNPGGGWEFPAFWAIALVVQSLLGDGAFALSRETR